ncbi:MAG: branched-chain amino acid ABC transporter permease [Deltaproteobacteria bacterium]|nr:branched-chain amino acid ABC transporter permease [Deltaproteobacteria bacterium]
MDIFITLTMNGLATGMLLFMMACGLSIIFGLMGIMNFAHGSFFVIGAYTSTYTYASTGSVALAMIAGLVAGVAVGLVMELTIIRRVYGNHVGQILITLGAFIVLNEIVLIIWGPNVIPSPTPALLDGTVNILGATISIYRLFIIGFSLLVAVVVHFSLTRTRLGTVVRAGVENAEMVNILGVNIKRVFAFVFILGTGLSALGGTMIGPTLGQIGPFLSTQYLLLSFIVVVIGGMGSFIGSMVAGIIVGLANNYIIWVYPPAALPLNIILMAVILIIKPTGLLGMKEAA